MQRKSKVNGSGVFAACIAAAGAIVAVAYFVKRSSDSRPESVVERCNRAFAELEQRVVKA